MADYLNVDHPGIRYGDGVMSGAGAIGECVELTGNDEFTKNVTAANRSFGILKEDVADGNKPVVICGGSIIRTNNYDKVTTPPTAGNDVEVDANGLLTLFAAGFPVGECISNSGGELKVKLYV